MFVSLARKTRFRLRFFLITCTVLPHISIRKATSVSTKNCGLTSQITTTHTNPRSLDTGNEPDDDNDEDYIPVIPKIEEHSEGMWVETLDPMDEMNSF